ncbi:MAG: hypothetical protein P4M08_04980 [Oligoflexia bacterium]|nr:hypothetical protein [Oligoflexia bacterium]
MDETTTPETPAQKTETRRFRVNPVEVLILMTMTIVVGNSAYNLLYGTDSFRPADFKSVAASAMTADNRGLASAASSAFANLEVKCQNGTESIKTLASKVRLSGVLCGAEGATGGQLVKATVLNNSNRFNASIFTDSNSPQFTTDYIPLAEGTNTLRIEFSYRGGKTSTQEINVSKLDPNAKPAEAIPSSSKRDDGKSDDSDSDSQND